MIRVAVRCMLLGLSLCVYTSCGGQKPELVPDDPEKLLDPTQIAVIQGSERDYTEPTVFEQNFGLHARAEGNEMVLSARNLSQQEITLGTADLALITGKRKEDLIPIHPGTADLSSFTPLILKPGERGTRRIPMTYLTDPRGTRLVYYNRRQNIRFYVEVN